MLCVALLITKVTSVQRRLIKRPLLHTDQTVLNERQDMEQLVKTKGNKTTDHQCQVYRFLTGRNIRSSQCGYRNQKNHTDNKNKNPVSHMPPHKNGNPETRIPLLLQPDNTKSFSSLFGRHNRTNHLFQLLNFRLLGVQLRLLVLNQLFLGHDFIRLGVHRLCHRSFGKTFSRSFI